MTIVTNTVTLIYFISLKDMSQQHAKTGKTGKTGFTGNTSPCYCSRGIERKNIVEDKRLINVMDTCFKTDTNKKPGPEGSVLGCPSKGLSPVVNTGTENSGVRNQNNESPSAQVYPRIVGAKRPQHHSVSCLLAKPFKGREICKKKKVNISELKGGSRRGEIPAIRAYLAKILTGDYGLSLAETARQLGVTTSAISKIFSRNA